MEDKKDYSKLTEEEFNASEDKSKKVVYIEPTYIPYLEGNASTSAFISMISIPLWYVDAPDVAAVRLPKYEEIVVYPGIGHAKFELP